MKIIFLSLLIGVVIASVASQFNNGFPSYPAMPNLNDLNNPNHPCNQPGANCKIESRFAEENSVNGQNIKLTRVCDERGCIETRVSSDASHFMSNLFLLASATLFATVKYLIR